MNNKKEIIRGIKFVLFSMTAGILQTIIFSILEELANFPYWPSYLIALIASVLYNFTVNRKFTFRSVANIPKAMFQLALYYAVFTPLSTWWGDRLTFFGWNDYLVLFLTMFINLVTEFSVCRFVIYKGQVDNREEVEKTFANLECQ